MKGVNFDRAKRRTLCTRADPSQLLPQRAAGSKWSRDPPGGPTAEPTYCSRSADALIHDAWYKLPLVRSLIRSHHAEQKSSPHSLRLPVFLPCTPKNFFLADKSTKTGVRVFNPIRTRTSSKGRRKKKLQSSLVHQQSSPIPG